MRYRLLVAVVAMTAPLAAACSSDGAGPPPAPAPNTSTAPAGCEPTGRPQRVDVVTYNIGSAKLASLTRFARVIRTSGADVVLVQEVDRFSPVSGDVDQARVLGRLTGLHHAFGSNVGYGGRVEYGTAVLSRFPVLSSENVLLPRPGGTQQRGLLHVVLDVGGSDGPDSAAELSVYTTHLQNGDAEARAAQASEINRVAAADPRPQVLGADVNDPPRSGPTTTLAEHWTDVWTHLGTGGGYTHPARRPRERIDYLMTAGRGVRAESVAVVPVKLSDHFPVLGRFVVRGCRPR